MNRAELSGEVRARLVRLPEPHQAHYGVVPTPPPEDGVALGDAARRHEKAMEALGRAQAFSAALKDRYMISRLLMRQEAVSSSAVEGTYSTLDELLVSDEPGEDDNLEPAVRQVRSYATVLSRFVNQAMKSGPDIFSIRLIRKLHKRVMEDDPDFADEPGNPRRVTVWIGGARIENSIFNPPPADRVEACLAQQVDYLRAEGLQAQKQSLVTRMAIAHAHFEAIHPFRDGNGRVGRLLLPMMMAADGYTPLYLAPYIEANKTAYYEALKQAQQRLDWPAMIGFMSDAVVGTVDELMTTREALETLQRLWSERSVFRHGSGATRALRLLPYHPVVTVRGMAHLLRVSIPAASRAIGQLVEAKVLVERTGYARNRIFAAPEALTVLKRTYGTQPRLPQR